MSTAMEDEVRSRTSLPDGMSFAEAKALIDSMYWHHSIDFGDGLVTPSAIGLNGTNEFAEALLSRFDLSGRSVLDIGAWTGAYSLYAKRRGAARVVAADKYVWTHPFFKGRDAFELARKLSGLDIDAHEIDVPFVTPDTVGVFDVVLFSGVFYHLINPVHLTRQVSLCARHALVVETHQDALDNPRPAMIFYPGGALNGDGSNWWGPNPHCMYEILTELGFAEILYRETPGFHGNARGIYHAFRDARSMSEMGTPAAVSPWVSLSDPAARQALFAPR